jgi:hypothetical protein
VVTEFLGRLAEGNPDWIADHFRALAALHGERGGVTLRIWSTAARRGAR